MVLFSVLALTACAIGPTRKQVLDGMIGQSETVLVRRLGVPTRTYDTGGHHFDAYVQQQQAIYPGYGYDGIGGGFGGFGGYGGYGGFGGLYGGGFTGDVAQFSCETTVEVDHAVVTGWSLHGNGCS